MNLFNNKYMLNLLDKIRCEKFFYDPHLSIIFNLKISKFFTVSSCPGTRDARFFRDLIIMDSASFLASFLASFFNSSSVRFSKNWGTISMTGRKYFFTVCNVRNS